MLKPILSLAGKPENTSRSGQKYYVIRMEKLRDPDMKTTRLRHQNPPTYIPYVPYLSLETLGVYFLEPYGENAIAGNQLFGFHNSFSLPSAPWQGLEWGNTPVFKLNQWLLIYHKLIMTL